MTTALRTTAVPASPLARWDARWKLGGLVLLAASAASVTRPGPAAVALGGGCGLALLGRLPVRDVLGRVGLLLLSVTPFVLLLPLTAGWAAAGTFALRLAAVGLVALVLARTASAGQTFAAAGELGAPRSLVAVALLAHRYAFLFAGELVRLRRAWRARGFRFATTRHAYRTVGQAVGSLAVRADDRAERVAAALRCRGFDGGMKPLDPFRTRPADVLGFLACVLAAVGLVSADRWL